MADFGVVNAVRLEVSLSYGLKRSRDTNDHDVSLPEALGDRCDITLLDGHRNAKPFVIAAGLEQYDICAGGNISVEAGKNLACCIAGHSGIDDFNIDLASSQQPLNAFRIGILDSDCIPCRVTRT